jgi:hypothetical protein
MNLGGSISKDEIFKNILSIGYEFEIALLAKFTYIPDNILVNTDLNIGRIREVEYSEEDDEYEINKKIRYEEIKHVESNDSRIIPTILNNNISDDLTDANNLLIQISTDVSSGVKTIKKLFEDYCVMNELKQKELLDLDTDYDDAKEKEQNKIKEMNKDNLYEFKIFENNEYTKVYKINFAHDSLRTCNEFTDVEFIATYYKPKTSENIILDTFTNAISNIIAYIDTLQIQHGSFFIKDSLQNDEYVIVKYPTLRNLLVDPKSSVRFINMNLNYTQEETDINNLTITPQMTFSCHVEHLFSIIKELHKNVGQTQNYDEFTNNINNNLQVQLSIIVRIENMVNELFRNYNEKYTPKFTDEQINILKNYVGLILYKLYKYYNSYLPESHRKKYLKDKLSINSRHLNIQLYDKLKENIANIIINTDNTDNTDKNQWIEHIKKFASKNNISYGCAMTTPECKESYKRKLEKSSIKTDMEWDKQIIDIIHNLILQPNILSNVQNGLIDKPDNVRKNAFNKLNILEKSNRNYGNPYYSLRSYFDYFENPIKNEEDVDEIEGGRKIKSDEVILDSSADNGNSSDDDSDNDEGIEGSDNDEGIEGSDNDEGIEGSDNDECSVNDIDNLDHDWLFNNNIDSFSSTLDIKDNIVLVEVRSFMKLFIVNYSNTIGNYNNQNSTLSFYKQFIEQYNNLQKPTSSGGKKLNKTKGKKLKNKTKQTKKYNKNKKRKN